MTETRHARLFGFPSPPRSPSSLATVGHNCEGLVVDHKAGCAAATAERGVQDAASLCARFSGSGSPPRFAARRLCFSCTCPSVSRPVCFGTQTTPLSAVEIRAHGRWTALSVSLMSRGQWATTDVGSCAASFGSLTAERARPAGPCFTLWLASARGEVLVFWPVSISADSLRTTSAASLRRVARRWSHTASGSGFHFQRDSLRMVSAAAPLPSPFSAVVVGA